MDGGGTKRSNKRRDVHTERYRNHIFVDNFRMLLPATSISNGLIVDITLHEGVQQVSAKKSRVSIKSPKLARMVV